MSLNLELLAADLGERARRVFGESRARELHDTLRDMASDLATLAEFECAPDDGPLGDDTA